MSENERTPLIFLPGLLCNRRLWEHQLQHLSDIAEMQVADLSRHDTVQALAAEVLETAPLRFALAGLSMGGYVALEMMRQAPHRVLKLALLDTTARPDTDDQLVRRRGLVELASTGKFRGVTPRLLPLLVHGDRQHDHALTQPIMAMAERMGQAAFCRQQTAIMGRPDSRPGLGAIRCPTLVMGGRQDVLTPPDIMLELAEAIPGAKFIIIEECGHLPPLERPQAATALLRNWLLYD